MSDGPGRFSDQFNVRLPDGMRDRLKAAAEANKRSMNAEIVARLEDSFGSADVKGEQDRASSAANEDNTLYILLDTNGLPISWQEAMTHLSQINKYGKLKFNTQNARILTTEHISSDGREDEDFALFLKYRRMNKHLLSKRSAAFLEEFESKKKAD